MRATSSLTALFFLVFMFQSEALSKESVPEWLVGYWHYTFDDGSTTDAIEFRKNGEYVDYSKDCIPVGTGRFELKNGSIYIIRTRSGIDKISSPMVPTGDHKHLIVVLKNNGKRASFWRSQVCVKNKG
jgi:hypothetical protein